MPIIQVENISKSFGRTKILDDISFSAEKGEIIGLVGKSYKARFNVSLIAL